MNVYCCLDRDLSIEPWGTTFLLPQLPVSFKALALFLSLPVSAKTLIHHEEYTTQPVKLEKKLYDAFCGSGLSFPGL